MPFSLGRARVVSDRILDLGFILLFVTRTAFLLHSHRLAFLDTSLAAAREPPSSSKLNAPPAAALYDRFIRVLGDVDKGDSKDVALLQVAVGDDGDLGSTGAERGAGGGLAGVGQVG